MTQAEEEKIQTLKERHFPRNLPLEVVQSNKYICGTLIDRREVYSHYMQSMQGMLR